MWHTQPMSSVSGPRVKYQVGDRPTWQRGSAIVPWLLLASAMGIACTPPLAPAFGSGLAHVAASGAAGRDERAMFERLNRDRVANGRARLEWDPRLSDVARHHSADMRDHRFFEHESPRTGSVDNRLDAAAYPFLTARENLSEAPDVEQSEDGLLESPHHHENIMAEDITHVGIGIVEGGVRDPRNITVTQVFAQPVKAETPERALGGLLRRLDAERAASRRPPARRDARLMQLAAQQLAELDQMGSPQSVEQASRAIVAALDGRQAGSALLSVQLVPSSGKVAFPDVLLGAPTCSVGVAVRAVKAKQGRPALQVLLLVEQTNPKR